MWQIQNRVFNTTDKAQFDKQCLNYTMVCNNLNQETNLVASILQWMILNDFSWSKSGMLAERRLLSPLKILQWI